MLITRKELNLYVTVITLPGEGNLKLSKGSERSVNWNEYKTKSEDKNTTNEYKYFLELNFVEVNRLFVLTYLSMDDNAERYKAWGYYLPKDVIKNYNVIIDGKNFHDQQIDSYVTQYQEIRKLTIGKINHY